MSDARQDPPARTLRPPPVESRTAGARRLRFGAMSGVLILAVTISAVLGVILAERSGLRWDVTATGEHRLSPRTTLLVEGLGDDYEIVVAANLRARAATQQLRDVLDQFEHAGDRIRTTLIDTSGTSGLEAFQGVIDRLADRERPEIERQRTTMLEAIGRARATASLLETTGGPSLARMGELVTDETANAPEIRQYLQQRAALTRLLARDLAAGADGAEAAFDGAPDSGPAGVPDLDAARQAIEKPLADAERELAGLAREMATFAESEGLPGEARSIGAALARSLSQARDGAAVSLDAVRRLKRLVVARVGRTLESGEAAIVIGPPSAGAVAMALDELFPETGEGAADVRRRMEDLLATAIGAVANPVKPIVVIVHGEARPFFEQAPVFKALIERMGRRGIDVVEWAAAANPEAPSLRELDPEGNRPIVYAVLAPDTAAGSGGEASQSGAERAARLGRALEALTRDGRPLLLSLGPSIFPSFGDVDPLARLLEPFGLEADVGRPLMRERVTPAGRLIETDQRVQAIEGEHPVQRAARTLPTFLPWAIALTEREGSDATVTALYRVAPDEAVWREAEWLRLWQTPREARAGAGEMARFDEKRDARGGPWLVGAAVEQSGTPQRRLIVIGSNGWFVDAVTQQRAVVDGRVVSVNPGNLELFEACVLWLAGQDDLIGSGPEARAMPIVRDLGEGAFAALRWALIGGLPVVILLVGLGWRAVRG